MSACESSDQNNWLWTLVMKERDDDGHPLPILRIDEHGFMVIGDDDALKGEDSPLAADGC